ASAASTTKRRFIAWCLSGEFSLTESRWLFRRYPPRSPGAFRYRRYVRHRAAGMTKLSPSAAASDDGHVREGVGSFVVSSSAPTGWEGRTLTIRSESETDTHRVECCDHEGTTEPLTGLTAVSAARHATNTLADEVRGGRADRADRLQGGRRFGT